MVNGLRTKPMVTVFTTMLTEPNTKVIGRMISNMVMVKKYGQMDLSMMVIIISERNKEKVYLYIYTHFCDYLYLRLLYLG